MGYPPGDHPKIPEVQEAIKRVRAAAKAAGKYAGMFCLTAEQVRQRAEEGCKPTTTSRNSATENSLTRALFQSTL
jgi:2-keto-3-deoxy-L-rhamnonate aldolase RhmA